MLAPSSSITAVESLRFRSFQMFRVKLQSLASCNLFRALLLLEVFNYSKYVSFFPNNNGTHNGVIEIINTKHSFTEEPCLDDVH